MVRDAARKLATYEDILGEPGGATYRILATYAGAVRVRAEPFEAIELSLASPWQR